MKYAVILGDGMADIPVPELCGKTPLQSANKPYMDYIAKNGITGIVKTIPDSLPPGSDVANLSVMGYDPLKYYTGRSPLEAVSIGVKLKANDTAFRCNFVCLSDEESYAKKIMKDYSSDEISTEEAGVLIEFLKQNLTYPRIILYKGISYRHCMVWEDAPSSFIPSPLTPPHDILDRRIDQYLPSCSNGALLLDIMKKSYCLLKDHPINESRVRRGLRPANSVWFWGEGRKPALDSFKTKYSLNASVISAVDLVKGIGICAGMKSVDVPGATGNFHTDYRAKGQAVLNEFESGADFVYIHIEAPDECGHRNELDNKIRSIELIDEHIAGPIIRYFSGKENYRIMVLPDHPTPLSLRTHTREPVPFAMYGSGIKASGINGYDEVNAEKSGFRLNSGTALMENFIMQNFIMQGTDPSKKD